MKEMKISDFEPMVGLAAKLAVTEGPFNDLEDVEITIQDEDGNEYSVQDIRFDTGAGTVVILFHHDN